MTTRTRRSMKVTTIRLGPDLQRLLEREAAHAGVSVSQFIREAALARASSAAALRGEEPIDVLAGAVREVAGTEASKPMRRHAARALAALTRVAAAETGGEAAALRAESEQARRRADEIAARAAGQPRPDKR
jgi:uncharacterized protein (DUF1778 family)